MILDKKIKGQFFTTSNPFYHDFFYEWMRKIPNLHKQKILEPLSNTRDYFGVSVALNSDATHMLVGANGDDSTVDRAGAVYYYTRSGSTWTRVAKIQASDKHTIQFFGNGVAINGDGNLDLNGNSDIDNWKISGLGSGYRGGAFESGILPGFRDLAISDRFYAGLAANTRRRTSGGRPPGGSGRISAG